MATIVVGAGLAGLTCAQLLNRHGRDVIVLEASDDIGGRVRSDVVDGFILDRGFQVLFDSYPAARRRLDMAALQLRRFDPGAVLCLEGRRAVLTDPLRDHHPRAVLQAALDPAISPRDKLAVLALAGELRAQPAEQAADPDELTTVSYLYGRGFSDTIIERFFRPFYGGIFLDRRLFTSAALFRSYFRLLSSGYACLPAAGMGTIARQLAAPLMARQSIHTTTTVTSLLADGDRVVGVRTASGEAIHGEQVVLATSAPEAARLSGLPMPEGALGVTCLYFAGEGALYRSKKIALNTAADALVNNIQQLSNVAPEYAPEGQHLLSAVVLGVPTLDDDELARRVLAEISVMFAGDAYAQRKLFGYRLLRVYRIAYAQFPQPPGLRATLPEAGPARPGLYLAGDYTEASSLNAAIASGERCAAAILHVADAASL